MIAELLCTAAVATMTPDVGPDARDVCETIAEAAASTTVPPDLAVALAWVESRWRWDAVSPAGAVGPMQVRADLHGDAEVATGLRILERYRDTVCPWTPADGRWSGECGELALASYNAGVRGALRLGRGREYAARVVEVRARIASALVCEVPA